MDASDVQSRKCIMMKNCAAGLLQRSTFPIHTDVSRLHQEDSLFPPVGLKCPRSILFRARYPPLHTGHGSTGDTDQRAQIRFLSSQCILPRNLSHHLYKSTAKSPLHRTNTPHLTSPQPYAYAIQNFSERSIPRKPDQGGHASSQI